MKFIEDQFNKMRPLFEKGGKLEKLWPLFEAQETFLFVKPDRNRQGAHIRDNSDTKRLMTIVIVALIPCFFFGIWNAGYQYYLGQGLAQPDFVACVLKGLRYVLPIVVVSYAVGGFWEIIFCVVRKHEVNEGFLVTGLLFPLVLPPTMPLIWVAVGVSFGVVIGKEVFGGTGMNVFNPALMARALCFFAYPKYISGEKVWRLVDHVTDSSGSVVPKMVDGFSGATPLLYAASLQSATGLKVPVVQALESFGTSTSIDPVTHLEIVHRFADFSWWSMFVGTIPGCIGETSTLAILLGAVVLLVTGVGSWRTMFGMGLGAFAMSTVSMLLNQKVHPDLFLALPPQYHFVMGGLMFGLVFMVTDPVSSAQTDLGKWIYGFFAGVLAIIIRLFNPAYPEGVMLAILFMNAFAPLIDYFVVQRNISRRMARVKATA